MSDAPIRVALPRGELRAPLAEQLAAVDFVAEGYGEGSRSYRFEVNGRPGVQVRVFSDEDTPIQVALGNYDLAICSRAWVDELLVRYRHDSIVPLRALDLPSEPLVIGGAAGSSLEDMASAGPVRVATEYPNLAQHVLTRLRIPNVQLFEVWAQAQAWPPDDAELAIGLQSELERDNLVTLGEAHGGGVWLIANRESLAQRNLEAALAPLMALPLGADAPGVASPRPLQIGNVKPAEPRPERDTFRIAVPDGHAQKGTVQALAAAGIEFDGYTEDRADRWPRSSIEGVEVKMMRPQDMPRAVALGGFDMALTGQDWLGVFESLFPAAPGNATLRPEAVELPARRRGVGGPAGRDDGRGRRLLAPRRSRPDDPARLGVRIAGGPVRPGPAPRAVPRDPAVGAPRRDSCRRTRRF